MKPIQNGWCSYHITGQVLASFTVAAGLWSRDLSDCPNIMISVFMAFLNEDGLLHDTLFAITT